MNESQAQLFKYDEFGHINGINIHGIKEWTLTKIKPHADLEPYLLLHYHLHSSYCACIYTDLTEQQIQDYRRDIAIAFDYLHRLIDLILEHDETTYLCNLQCAPGHCPNRIKLENLPDPQ